MPPATKKAQQPPPSAAHIPTSPDEYDFESVLAALKAPVPQEFIKQRVSHRGKDGQPVYVDFIEWHYAADVLDELYPFWTNSIELEFHGEAIIAKVGLTICGVTRYGIGVGDSTKEMGLKKAEHDGLKRAAVKFGLARALYQKEAHAEESEGSYQSSYGSSGGFPANPLATSVNDAVTGKQLGMIRAVCNNIHVDPDMECYAAMQIPLEHMSKKAASAFIDHIKGIENGTAASLQTAGGEPPVGAAPPYDPNYGPPVQPQAQQPPPMRRAPAPAQQPFPTHAGPPPAVATAPPPMPTAPAQAASPQQGRMAINAQIQAIRKIAAGIGYSEEDVALEYSNQRTNNLAQLSEAEAATAIRLLQGS